MLWPSNADLQNNRGAYLRILDPWVWKGNLRGMVYILIRRIDGTILPTIRRSSYSPGGTSRLSSSNQLRATWMAPIASSSLSLSRNLWPSLLTLNWRWGNGAALKVTQNQSTRRILRRGEARIFELTGNWIGYTTCDSSTSSLTLALGTRGATPAAITSSVLRSLIFDLMTFNMPPTCDSDHSTKILMFVATKAFLSNFC